MKAIIDRLIFGARVAVVALALVALVVSGAGAASRLFETPEEPESEPLPANATLDNKPTPEEAPGEMATGGRPWTEQSACWQASQADLGSTPQSRLTILSDRLLAPNINHAMSEQSASLAVTPRGVDHRIGLRQTLLGQKPSGTS